jgi:hypothetical protein
VRTVGKLQVFRRPSPERVRKNPVYYQTIDLQINFGSLNGRDKHAQAFDLQVDSIIIGLFHFDRVRGRWWWWRHYGGKQQQRE